MSTAVSYKGQCLSDISLCKEKVFPPITGPSCVIRLDSHPELEESTRKILEATEFTGCASLDYVICEKTKQAYLIEMNPRPTPPLSTSPLMGRDLPQALLSIAQGDPKVFEPREPEHSKIAAYPGEVLRDPNSEYIQQHYHDVPVDDPALEHALQEYIRQQRIQQAA